MDISHLLLGNACVITFLVGAPGFDLVLAFAVYLRWFGVLYYLRGFEVTGTLVRMIIAIIQDIRWFLMVLALAVCAVANFYFLLLNGQRVCFPLEDGTPNTDVGCEAVVDKFSDPGVSLFTISKMLLFGGQDLGYYEPSTYKAALQMVFALTMLFVVIVMLNLLIAIMGSAHDRIAERTQMELNFLRAEIVLEVELFMSAAEKEDKTLFPPFIHVLVQRKADTAKMSMEEKLDAQDKKMDVNKQELDKKIDALITKQELDGKKIDALTKMMELLLARTSSTPTFTKANTMSESISKELFEQNDLDVLS